MLEARRVVLRSYPSGALGAGDFEVIHREVREPAEGEAIIANIYATVDPAQSRRMRRYANYIAPFQLGELIAGPCLGQVIRSRSTLFREGDFWTHWGGWESHSLVATPRHYGAADHVLMQKADPALAPLPNYLGPLGGKGITAWIAMKLLGQVKPGDQVLVSAAAGAVGSIAGQLARAYGAERLAGIASGERKARYLTDVLGFDCAVDRAGGDIGATIDHLLPSGIDVYLDNVGGPLQSIVAERMRNFGRFVISGTVSDYGLDEPPPGPNLFVTVRRTFSIHGFLATHFYDHFAEFHAEMLGHLAQGRLHATFDVVDGLDNAGRAMVGMLAGDNIGQRLLRIARDPTEGHDP